MTFLEKLHAALFVLLVLVVCGISAAQPVKAFSIAKNASCNSHVSIATVEDEFSNNYIPYMDGCKASAFSLALGQPEFSVDLKAAGLDSASYVGLYKGVFADGQWVVFASFAPSNGGYDIFLYDGGKKSFLAKGVGNILPNIKKAGSSVYLVVDGKDEISVFVARNDLTASSITLRKSGNFTELLNVGPGIRQFDLQGRQLKSLHDGSRVYVTK